jgi:hypothetical protein
VFITQKDWLTLGTHLFQKQSSFRLSFIFEQGEQQISAIIMSSEDSEVGMAQKELANDYTKEMELQKQKSLAFAKKFKPVAQHKADEVEDFDLDKYPVREWKIDLPWLSEDIAFNPLVCFIGISLLWGLAIWCMCKFCEANKEIFDLGASLRFQFHLPRRLLVSHSSRSCGQCCHLIGVAVVHYPLLQLALYWNSGCLLLLFVVHLL